jgi:dTDP-4-dehydrorhamnose reductase
VFSGDAGPYGRERTPDPISAYGRVKLEAERVIGRDGLILRTSMVYSDDPDSKNFHNFVRDALTAGKEVKAFSDQTGSPTYAPDLARFAAHSAGVRHGLMHYAGPEVLTRVEFAVRVARAYGLKESLIRPVTSAELPLPAPRPKERGGLIVELESVSVDAALAEMSKQYRTRA